MERLRFLESLTYRIISIFKVRDEGSGIEEISSPATIIVDK
ncbi:hypothetical protein HanRHA438_Chr11g0511451 [Helianthus annuus]|nr:hypothetical protein HanRHA438_Chr11g0511451 [Helianthus annuus]